VRIDPAAPHMLQEVARTINGEAFRSDLIENRREQLNTERAALEGEGQRLQKERIALLENQGFNPDFDKEWADYAKRQKAYHQRNLDFQARAERFLRAQIDQQSLKGVNVVSSPLVWAEGHPVDGSGALSRWFDDRPFKAAVWFQSAGDTRGQSWSGPF